jgi:hypothetical protein
MSRHAVLCTARAFCMWQNNLIIRRNSEKLAELMKRLEVRDVHRAFVYWNQVSRFQKAVQQVLSILPLRVPTHIVPPGCAKPPCSRCCLSCHGPSALRETVDSPAGCCCCFYSKELAHSVRVCSVQLPQMICLINLRQSSTRQFSNLAFSRNVCSVCSR